MPNPVINTNVGLTKYLNDTDHLKAKFANLESWGTVALPLTGYFGMMFCVTTLNKNMKI